MAYPKIRIYVRERRCRGPLEWHYVCSTIRFPTIQEAVSNFARGFRPGKEFVGHPAATHGYYIED